jgi:hypothetical protein
MCIVAIPERLTSAKVVFFGEHGDITEYARERDISRQSVYREADSVLRDLQDDDLSQEIAFLRQRCDELIESVKALVADALDSVVVSTERQAEFACTAQAEGVSLPATRRLLAVFLRDKTPSVAKLGRFSRQAGLRSAALLEVFDEQTRPRVQEAGLDEIFFGQKPALMTVEPESLCWVGGRLAPSRDGEEWAKELRPLSKLEHVMRDGAKGIQNGLARVNQEREEAKEKSATEEVDDLNPQREKEKKKPITDQLDHFHTLREGRRAVRKTQHEAEKAWSKAEEADKKVARQDRHGQALTGYATQATLAWQKAEQTFHQWENDERTFEEIREALLPFTPEGELNTREKARQRVEELLVQLPGTHWDKFKRQLRQPETYTYLDRLAGKIKALPVAPEVRKAVVQSEGIRQNPELVQGEGQKQAVTRGILLVNSVVIASAGEAGRQAVAALRQAVRYSGRASSCVEGLNSVVRMQQGRHRKMTQGLLDLKRLYWNMRKFRTGRRKKTSPYERLGVLLPPKLSWWQVLQMTPDQLRPLLSALPKAA